MKNQEIKLLSLLRSEPQSAGALRASLALPQTSFSRLAGSLERAGTIRRFFRGPASRYARLRVARNLTSPNIPVHRILPDGAYQKLGTLWTVEGGTIFELGPKAETEFFKNALPWFLQDMRPQGFPGRTLPALYPEMNLPARLKDWSDDAVLYWLTAKGEDCPGNLVLGEESFRRFLQARVTEPPVVQRENRIPEYERMARAAMKGSPHGSSPGGEQPKFGALRGSPPEHVMVKFSPPRDSAAGTRWADLLVCEDLALKVLRNAGVSAAETELLTGERYFLDVVRFDRAGRGRRGVASFEAIDGYAYGFMDNWPRAAERMMRDGWLRREDYDTVLLVHAFGQLIANTDMHFGNISVLTEGPRPYSLAPIYDCLPMAYKPENEQMKDSEMTVLFPHSAESVPAWKSAFGMAQIFWDKAARDSRISEGFRKIAALNLKVLKNTNVDAL